MKRILVLLLFTFTSIATVSAQGDTAIVADTVWRTGGLFSSSFNQVSLINWAAGGQNSMSLNNIVSLFAKYKKGKVAWDNTLDMGYGLVQQGEEKIRKNDDRLELNSKLGIQAQESKFYYTLLFNFRSQFAEGYNYPRNDSSQYISKFAAPAFTLFALGMDYKPSDYFSVFIAPITARAIIVNDDRLSKEGAYGVDPGEKYRLETGAYLNTRFQKDVLKNVNFMTKLDLFSNYQEDPGNIDVNWEVLITMNVNSYLSVSIGTQLIYDDNTKIALFRDVDGVQVPIFKMDETGALVQKTGPRTQFRQIFGVGLTYKIEGFTVR